MRLNKQKERKYANKAWLQDNYHNKRLTMCELAKLSNCDYVTIWTWMNKFNIKRRNHSEAFKPRPENHFNLTKEIEDFISGLLLGDGTISINNSRGKGAIYEHADKRKKYLIWLSTKFHKYKLKQCGRINLMKCAKNGAYKYKTLTYTELRIIRNNWYPLGKKEIPKDLKLTPTMLKNWYIGDGNFSDSPLIDSSSFSFESLKKLASQIEDLGITLTLREFKCRKRIRISKKSETKFFQYILSDEKEIPAGYTYKFPKEVSGCV